MLVTDIPVFDDCSTAADQAYLMLLIAIGSDVFLILMSFLVCFVKSATSLYYAIFTISVPAAITTGLAIYFWQWQCYIDFDVMGSGSRYSQESYDLAVSFVYFILFYFVLFLTVSFVT